MRAPGFSRPKTGVVLLWLGWLIALASQPASAASSSQLAEEEPARLFPEAYALLQAGNPAQAEQAMASHSLSNHPAAGLLRGWIRLEQRDLEPALAHFESAVALSPTNSACWVWKARTLGRLAERAGIPSGITRAIQCRQAFERAVQLDPDNHRARLDLIQFYLDAPVFVGGGTKRASREIEELGKRDPYLGHVARGMLDEAQNKWVEAAKAYREAIQSDTNRAKAYYSLGELFLRKHNYEPAQAAFERILVLKPASEYRYQLQSTDALFYLGQLHFQVGRDLGKAEDYLRRYLDCHPNVLMPPPEEAHLLLAKLHERQGRLREAVSDCRAALALDSHHKEAKRLLRRLEGQLE